MKCYSYQAPLLCSAVLLASFCFLGGPLCADEWRDYRGPTGQGHAQAHDLPLNWSETQNVTWKTPLPGRGWSTPVVGKEMIWLTTAIEEMLTKEEQEKRLAGLPNSSLLTTSGRLELLALGLDRASGKLVHKVSLATLDTPYALHSKNSYASPSPLLESGRVICSFGSHGTFAVDAATGEKLWENRELKINHENGAGSTPVAYKDLCILHFDGSDQQFIAALRQADGRIAWKTTRSGKLSDQIQEKKAYGTPLVTKVDGRDLLLSPAADWLYAYDPATGKELWKLNYEVLGYSIVPRPVVGNGMVYMCTSFNASDILAIRFDAGKGEIAWRRDRKGSQIPSPLLVGDRLYNAADDGVIECLDALTGKLIWTKRVGGERCSSPLWADGRIYFCNREGVTTVISPADTFEKLAENQLDGSFMASPVAVDKELYLRTDKALYRIENH